MEVVPSPQARRAAEKCFGHFCVHPVMPSIERLPAMEEIIERETKISDAELLILSLLRFVDHTKDCRLVQRGQRKGPCDCGVYAMERKAKDFLNKND